MTDESYNQELDRRGFLKAAAFTAAAATVTGAGAAFLRSPQQARTASIPPRLPVISEAISSKNPDATAEIFAQLASAHAENVRLQAELDAAQRRLLAEQSVDDQAALMRAELDTATQRATLLGGLVALYEQMDGIKLDQLLDDGLAALSTGISELMEDVPTLAEGIETGRLALEEFESQLPLLEDGRVWLDEQTSRLDAFYRAVESSLAAAVDAAGPLITMLAEWAQNVLKWLPFGLGERTRTIFESMTNLLTATPPTITGLRSNVAEPLALWFVGEDGEAPLRRNLVEPIRESVLDKASLTAGRAADVQAVYQANLVHPAQTAVTSQQAVRALIADYRQRHQI